MFVIGFYDQKLPLKMRKDHNTYTIHITIQFNSISQSQFNFDQNKISQYTNILEDLFPISRLIFVK